MNKDRRQGFAAGLLTAAILLGLGGAALADGRTIRVDDEISVTVNGVPFTPRNEQGEEVPIFACGGTTYAPIRAFSQAAGLTVDYDASTRTARVETSDYAAALDPQADSYIAADRARELALRDAGVDAADALFLKSCLDWEDGRAVYDVEFCAGSSEYDYELDALTGAVLKKESDLPNFDWTCRDYYHIDRGFCADTSHCEIGHHNRYGEGQGVGQNAQSGQTGGPCQLSENDAKTIALERLGGGTVVKCEFDYGGGQCKYELELRLDGVEYECEVDAQTGAILKWERDH